jgi:hypothetical protein
MYGRFLGLVRMLVVQIGHRERLTGIAQIAPDAARRAEVSWASRA